jgi:hypothetical protein
MALWILQVKGHVHGSIFDHSVLQILIVGDGLPRRVGISGMVFSHPLMSGSSMPLLCSIC